MPGTVEVIALSDGSIGLDARLLHAAHPDKLDSALKFSDLSQSIDTSVNAYLIRLADRLILVDAGTGTLFGPTLNRLPASLRSAGYDTDQVTDILATHVHTDHTGGSLRRIHAGPPACPDQS